MGDDYQSNDPIRSYTLVLGPAHNQMNGKGSLANLEKRILTLESQVRLLDDELADCKAKLKQIQRPDERVRQILHD